MALLDGDPQMAGDLEDPSAGDPFKNVVADRRCDEHAIADHEQVFGRALGDVTLLSQDDGLFEPIEHGLGLGEGRIHVAAGDLAARRDGRVAGPPPRDRPGRDPLLGVDVVAHGDGQDVELVGQPVELDADRLRALVHRGTAVGVFVEVVPAQDLEDDLGELLDSRHLGHEHDLARVAQADDVLLDPERVQLLLFCVPVGPDALEDGGSIQEGVGHDRDASLAERYVRALEIANEAVLVGLRRRARGRGRCVLRDHLSSLPGADRRQQAGESEL